MKPRRWWHRIAAYVLTKIVRLYIKTLRIQTFGKDRTIQELSTSPTGCVFLLWHDSILLLVPLVEWATALQPICLLISYSRDGDIAAEMGKQFSNVSVIRVKHTSRAVALVESCHLLNNRHSILVTPDGPRGPRHQIKLGALFACQKCGASVIPIVYAASSQYTLSSWDRFRIPLPFSRVLLSTLEPIPCPAGGGLDQFKEEIERKMTAEEERLQALLNKKSS
jgi:lysophospholipid acyltransferase (LPLAT)-like uncharacterized protein